MKYDFKLLGYNLGSGLSITAMLLLVPIVLVVGLAIGGAVIWGVTNVWDMTINSVDTPNPNYWESVMFFGGLWLIARMLSDTN